LDVRPFSLREKDRMRGMDCYPLTPTLSRREREKTVLRREDRELDG